MGGENKDIKKSSGGPGIYMKYLPFIVIAAAAVAALICAGALMGKMMLLTIALITACIPGIAVFVFIYRSDRIEPEPAGLLLLLFILGALVYIPSRLIEWGFTMLFNEGGGSLIGSIVYTFLCVALIEELCRFIVLRLITWNHKEFDYRFDGVVYAATVAIGFEAAESIMFLAGGMDISGFVKAAIPGHCIFGLYMGYFYGLAKARAIAGDKKGSVVFQAAAVVVPFLLHGLYDTFVKGTGSPVIKVVLVVFILVLGIVSFVCVKRFSDSDAAL